MNPTKDTHHHAERSGGRRARRPRRRRVRRQLGQQQRRRDECREDGRRARLHLRLASTGLGKVLVDARAAPCTCSVPITARRARAAGRARPPGRRCAPTASPPSAAACRASAVATTKRSDGQSAGRLPRPSALHVRRRHEGRRHDRAGHQRVRRALVRRDGFGRPGLRRRKQQWLLARCPAPPRGSAEASPSARQRARPTASGRGARRRGGGPRPAVRGAVPRCALDRPAVPRQRGSDGSFVLAGLAVAPHAGARRARRRRDLRGRAREPRGSATGPVCSAGRRRAGARRRSSPWRAEVAAVLLLAAALAASAVERR